jgi:transcriptional regulator with XRE-family HTH domain
MGETKLQREARLREPEARRAIGRSLRDIRVDAGLTIAAVARAVGIDRSYLSRIERGERAGSLRVLIAVATVLGADLSVKVYPNTGPRIRDRHQAPMGEAIVRGVHRRWMPDPEVPVHEPARGVIDIVLTDRESPTIVAIEIQSVVTRLEQHADTASHLIGEQKYRIWRVYMAGSAHAFDRGWLELWQVLAGKGVSGEQPHYRFSREYQYR